MLYNYFFKFLDSDGNYYKLRLEYLSSVFIKYRYKGNEDSFSICNDFNIDEKENKLWVRLPKGELEIVINLNVERLKTITTSLKTIDFNEFDKGFVVSSTPVPLFSFQGYSPRIIDGFWYEYSDENQCFVNTGIEAKSGEIQGVEVVDFVENGNQNAVTSNAVFDSINNVNQSITSIENNLENVNQSINNLNNHKVSVVENGNIHEEDIDGFIDLGTLKPNTLMLDRLTKIDGTFYPKGTQITDEQNPTIVSTDSNYYYQFNCNSEFPFYKLFDINQGCEIQFLLSQIGMEVFGSVFIVRNSLNEWVYNSTNEDLSKRVFIYKENPRSNPVFCVRSSQSQFPLKVTIKSSDKVRIIDSGSDIDLSKVFTINHFLTNEKKDFLTIDSNEYEQPIETLNITNFVVKVDGEINFGFDSTLDFPVSLNFSITNDDTTLKISDGNFESQSKSLKGGEIASFIFSDSETFYWNYSEEQSGILTDIKIDDDSCVVGNVGFINSLSDDELNDLKSIFN